MEVITESKIKFLNRDAIKYIAMLTMLLNHIANVFLPPDTWAYELMLSIGYFTAPTMIYFLVEGYRYTHSPVSYLKRMLLFALLSEIPFCLAFTWEGVIRFQGFNMLFTLCLCLLLIMAIDRLEKPWQKVCVSVIAIFLSLFCDWAIFAPVFTLLFCWADGNKPRVKQAYAAAVILFWCFCFLQCIGNVYGELSLSVSLARSFVNASGVLLSGLCICLLYNGKRANRFQMFSKWFFYGFYPVHLLILGLIRISVSL